VKVRGRFTSYRKLVPGRQNTFGVSKSRHCGFRALLATLHAKEHDGGDEQQRRRRDTAGGRAETSGARSRNASHSPARQRRWRPPAAHALSGGDFCSAALQAPGAGGSGSPAACAMRAPAASPMEGTAPLLRGPRRAAVRVGHPRRDAVTQAVFPAVSPRGSAGAARARPAGRQRARGACWRAFCCGMWGCLRSLTKRMLACVQVAVEMPFSSTLAAAAGATERLRGCTVARKISLLALSIFAHRGVGRR
jgi:hypothetical protein